MKESFLHLVWQQQLIQNKKIYTTEGEELIIHHPGEVNLLQGPDFSSAMIEIANQKWAGNIEIHLKSSDWYAHQHQKDTSYSNVILHVVFEHDIEVFDLQSNSVPTLELSTLIKGSALQNYNELMQQSQYWIFCENKIKAFDTFKWQHWMERLYVERLERKVGEIELIFNKTKQDWEATFFLLLAKSFGGNLNGAIFLKAFSQVEFIVIRKQIANNKTASLLFGLLGLLKESSFEDLYCQILKKRFDDQRQKYRLEEFPLPKLNFFWCRPHNFPTIRLAQLIAFYEKHKTVFSKVLGLGENLKSYQDFFDIEIDEYWKTHYNLDKVSKKSSKKISKNFLDLLLMNVVIPFLFLYAKKMGTDESYLLDLMYQISPEKNNIVAKFSALDVKSKSALETQALLTLKKEYCDKERCAACDLGVHIIA